MFLLNNTNYKYSNSHKALDESGKETFTKDDIIPAKVFLKRRKKRNRKTKKQNSQNWEFFLSLEFRKCVSSF